MQVVCLLFMRSIEPPTYLHRQRRHVNVSEMVWSKKTGIDITHKALKKGAIGEDGIFRQIILVIDAIKGGANFFNMDKLRRSTPLKYF